MNSQSFACIQMAEGSCMVRREESKGQEVNVMHNPRLQIHKSRPRQSQLHWDC